MGHSNKKRWIQWAPLIVCLTSPTSSFQMESLPSSLIIMPLPGLFCPKKVLVYSCWLGVWPFIFSVLSAPNTRPLLFSLVPENFLSLTLLLCQPLSSLLLCIVHALLLTITEEGQWGERRCWQLGTTLISRFGGEEIINSHEEVSPILEYNSLNQRDLYEE